MVIQCSACQTRFRLAEEKIKPQGTKVRCSKCGEVFTVFPPAPVQEPPSPPSPGEEFVPPTDGSDISAAAKAAVMGTEDGSDDWSNFRAAASDEPAPPASGTDFEGILQEGTEGPTAGDEEFAFDGGADGEEEEVFFEEEPGGEEDDFSLDVGETAGSATEDLSPLEFDTLSFDTPSESAATDEDFTGGIGAGTDDELAFEESEDSPFPPFSAEVDEDAFAWGEEERTASAPGEFDFGDHPDGEPDAESGESDLLAAVTAMETPAAKPAPPQPAAAETPAPPPPPPNLPVDRSQYARRKGKTKRGTGILTWLVILILLGLCAATGYFYWIGRFPDVNALLNRFMPPAATAPAASKIKVTELKGFFLNNVEAGQLFVVQGQAVNGYAEPRSAMAVKGQLFNKDGKLLRERSAYCGNALADSELRSLPLSRLRERSDNQFGDSLSNLNVAPGKSVPFTIVFSSLPPDLAEFTVEPGDSIPGSKQ